LQQIFEDEARIRPRYFSDQPFQIGQDQEDAHISLTPARYLLFGRTGEGRVGKMDNISALTATVFERAFQIRRALSGEAVEVIIGTSGSPFDLPAAWIAARLLRKPFAAWLFDDPVMQWTTDTNYRPFARFWERLWAPGSVIISPNETMAEDFIGRHSRAKPHLVRNPAPEIAFATPDATWPRRQGPLRIVYTGSLYSAQADAARDLVKALALLGGSAEWVIYSAQSPETLALIGIAGPHVTVLPALPHMESIHRQQEADILFLPLAFESEIPEVIRSSAPAKMAEYIASTRPVVIHAPPGSFVNRFFRESGAGIVVDTKGPDGIVKAIESLTAQPELRASLMSAAVRVRHQFSTEAARLSLCAALWGEER